MNRLSRFFCCSSICFALLAALVLGPSTVQAGKPSATPAEVNRRRVDGQIRGIQALAEKGAKVTLLSRPGAQYPLYRIDIPAKDPRPGKQPAKIGVLTQLHGNEETLPVALRLGTYALSHPTFQQQNDLSIFVKVERFGTRETPRHIDQNRRFAPGKWTTVTRTLRDALKGKTFDLFLDLHADSDLPAAVVVNESKAADSWKVISRGLRGIPTKQLLRAPRGGPTLVRDYDLRFPGAGATPSSEFSGCADQFMGKRTPYSFTVEAPANVLTKRQERQMTRLVRGLIHAAANGSGDTPAVRR
jgi:hypothetical protein